MFVELRVSGTLARLREAAHGYRVEANLSQPAVTSVWGRSQRNAVCVPAELDDHKRCDALIFLYFFNNFII